MPNKNSNSDLLTSDERALYIRSSLQGVQRIYGECMAKYEEDGIKEKYEEESKRTFIVMATSMILGNRSIHAWKLNQ
jgi:hypothetical protein